MYLHATGDVGTDGYLDLPLVELKVVRTQQILTRGMYYLFPKFEYKTLI